MYRYAKREYSKRLLMMGSVRIGTLHDFRRSEHKRGIADPGEGHKRVSHCQESLLHISDSTDPALQASKDFRAFRHFGVLASSAKLIDAEFGYNVFHKKINAPDCFVFCSSGTLSRDTMREFEEADSSVEIIDIDRFYALLTGALNAVRSVTFCGIHAVRYQDREEIWNGRDWGHHPALIKETKHRGQAEIRAIWEPLSSAPIQPIITGDYRLGAVCREVAI